MRGTAALAASTLVAAACASDGTEFGDAAAAHPDVEASSVSAATTTPPTAASSTTTTVAPTTTTAATVPEAEVGGTGVDHAVLMDAMAPLMVAENAMHDFEARWDAGMTYSETFRGWREVRAIVEDAFAAFEFPVDASAEQLAAGQVYVDAVIGAQVEWQNVTDFIVTYITNYTPEALIQGAYTKAEFKLRDAIAALRALEAMGTS